MCKFCCGVFLALVILLVGGVAGALYMYCRENPEAKNELVDMTKTCWDNVKDVGDKCMDDMTDKTSKAKDAASVVGREIGRGASRVGRTGSRIGEAIEDF